MFALYVQFSSGNAGYIKGRGPAVTDETKKDFLGKYPCKVFPSKEAAEHFLESLTIYEVSYWEIVALD